MIHHKNFQKTKGPKGPVDKNMTTEVENKELLELLNTYNADHSPENLNRLIQHLITRRVLLPGMFNAKKMPIPCLITNEKGDHFLPIFTDKDQMDSKKPSQCVLNMPFLAVNQNALNPDMKIKGIVINPFTSNLILLMPMLERIKEVEEKRASGEMEAEPKKKQLKLTEEQYVVFERIQFEVRFLPTKLYTGGQEFVDALCEKRETLIDELYEESYQEKKMYPYLDEDFAVMPMEISEDLLLIRVDMPARDMAQSVAYRVYLAWNKKLQKAGYYRIAAGEDRKQMILEEITPEIKLINHGEAPVEGAQLQKIVDLITGEAQDEK